MKGIDGEFLYVISLSILLIISLVISFKSKASKEPAGRFLIIYFWSLWYALFAAFMVLFKHAHAVPHLIRTGHLATVIILPASYLYVSLTLKPRRLKLSDLLHLLPAAIFIIDYLPFFIQPAADKIRIMESLDGTQLRIGYTEGWFMFQYGHFVIRYIQIFAYTTG